MNARLFIVKTLLATLCLAQQPVKSAVEPGHAVTIFEKPLSSTKKLIVICEELSIVTPPKQAVELNEISRTSPGVIISNHLYAYSYVIVTKAGQRNVLWTHRQPTFGAITPGKTGEMSFSIEVLDVAFQGCTLFVLDKQGNRTAIKIIHLDPARNSVASRATQKQPTPTQSTGAAQYLSNQGHALENVGSYDDIVSGRILGPTTNGNLEVQLSHAAKQKDGSLRITAYYLTHDAQGREFWTPDPANIYAKGERPNTQ